MLRGVCNQDNAAQNGSGAEQGRALPDGQFWYAGMRFRTAVVVFHGLAQLAVDTRVACIIRPDR
jgi:hypothetical protein